MEQPGQFNIEETPNSPTSPPVPAPAEQPLPPPADNPQASVPRFVWQGKIGPAFWTIASILSLTINVILIVVVIFLARYILTATNAVSSQLIDGLHANFVKMDQATIITEVKVKDTIPVVFDLPTKTNTTVTLIEPTRIKGAVVNLRTGGLSISNAPANIVLPAGTRLPIALDMVVPVSTTIPVELTVPVNIPLDQTELHEPFVGLQQVLSPYQTLLSRLPGSWEETSMCAPPAPKICSWLIKPE